MLFEMDKDEEEFILSGGQGRVLIGGVAAVLSRETIDGGGTHMFQKDMLKVRE
jgi:hypothetical protein